MPPYQEAEPGLTATPLSEVNETESSEAWDVRCDRNPFQPAPTAAAPSVSSRTVPREPEHGAIGDSKTLHCPLRVCGDALGLQTPPRSTSEGWDPWITPALTPHGSLQAPHSAAERVQQQGREGAAQKAEDKPCPHLHPHRHGTFLLTLL